MRNILSTPVRYMVYLPSEVVPNETLFNPDKFDLLYYKAPSNDCASAIFPSLSAPRTCLKSDRLRPLKKAFYTVIYAYFRWEALTLSWETVQYSIVVSSFS